ncbi:phage protein, HK97 gp10 family [Streptomyces sp. DI166]|uniref:HK97-gp10 family putative phage morphogenesis protein n=1 Tax=Streptomyces sp. DI166 TaxID=1839783 RepID=UPI0007F465E1|nr:HK97-gp10 family putative phage morphogenesis protein [Streptomyces sp. DI166]SBT89375.1 phage protein, HK97 gp10 family [Streptomyces sp. DI166]
MARSVRISGTARLRQRLEELPEDIKDALKKGVRESAEAVRDDVKQHVRVDSGNLRDTAAIRYEENGLAASIGWHDPSEFYAVFQERGTRRVPANPTLLPALERERGKYRARLTDEVRRVLR